MKFIMNGNKYELTKEDVENAMKEVDPETIRKYYFVINRRKYPPNQILTKALNLKKSQVKTTYSVNILPRLGFKLNSEPD